MGYFSSETFHFPCFGVVSVILAAAIGGAGSVGSWGSRIIIYYWN
jgi:hypothetical protein